MLASTVQFSTNDQPTTTTPRTSITFMTGMRGQAVPGAEKQQPGDPSQAPAAADLRLFLQIPNRVLSFVALPSRTSSRSTEENFVY
jgi:hypothetical protein